MTEDELLRFERTRAETDRPMLEFIGTEISMGTTFAELSRTEYSIGNFEHAVHVHGEADKANRTGLNKPRSDGQRASNNGSRQRR